MLYFECKTNCFFLFVLWKVSMLRKLFRIKKSLHNALVLIEHCILEMAQTRATKTFCVETCIFHKHKSRCIAEAINTNYSSFKVTIYWIKSMHRLKAVEYFSSPTECVVVYATKSKCEECKYAGYMWWETFMNINRKW